MSELRNLLRQQIEGREEPEPESWSRRLANYAREECEAQEARAARKAAEAAEAAKPKPQSLPEQLRWLISGSGEAPTWSEVRAELDRRVEARKQQTLVEALQEALGEQKQYETPSLNDARLLTVLGSADSSQSTREAVAKLLHDHRLSNFRRNAGDQM